MKIDSVKLKCKKGHGITDHGVYKYGNSTVFSCLECAKERRNQRKQDPEKVANDLAYTKRWFQNNKQYCKEREKLRAKKAKEKRDAEVMKFLNTERIYKNIKRYLESLQSDYTWEDVEKYCLRMHVTSLPKVKQYIHSNKMSKLRDAEIYKASALIKYHYGIQDSWGNLPQEVKEKIRKEYKSKGTKNAMEKLKTLEKCYRQ